MKVIIQLRYAQLLKSFLFLLLFIFLILGGFFLYFYFHYASRIDRAFQECPWERFPTIYSAPTLIFSGQALTFDDLEEMLQKRGYTLSSFLEPPPAYKPLLEHQSILIANSRDWSVSGPSSPHGIKVVFRDDHVQSIATLAENRLIPGCAIRPALLASQQSGERRMNLSFDDIPPNLMYAVLAAEDRRFFDHPGLDVVGIIRSLFRNIREEKIVEGGSTITQQLAKNIFLTPRKTLTRKLEEAFISMILETRLSKKELFEIYSNITYLGQTATFSIYGFAQAADIYCNKNIRNLTLSECALLAGMIRSPNQYHPFRHSERALDRRNHVLESMEKAGYILPKEAMTAAAAPLPLPQSDFFRDLKAPYFLDYLASILKTPQWRSYLRSDRVLFTSLNLELQHSVETAMAEGMRKIEEKLAMDYPKEPADKLQSAFVVLSSRTGEILAMSGGRDYLKSQFNRAVYSRRQAGSILKPFIYAFLLDAAHQRPDLQLTAASTVTDRPVSIPYGRRTYRPHNYKNIYFGRVTMKTALSRSLNTATVLFAQQVGFEPLSVFINQLGFVSKAVPYPSIALGTVDVSPLEIASAYTIFTNDGKMVFRKFWKQGLIQPESGQVNTRTIISPGAAFITLDMLQETVNSGTAKNIRRLGIQMPLAGKTGTAKDGWFVGLTGNLVCCSWVGYDENRDFPLSGGQSALIIFTSFITHAGTVYPVKALQIVPPQGMTCRRICSKSGHLATSACPKTEMDYFFPGSAPHISCQIHH